MDIKRTKLSVEQHLQETEKQVKSLTGSVDTAEDRKHETAEENIKIYKFNYVPNDWIKLDDRRMEVDIRVRKVNIGILSTVLDENYMKMKFQTSDSEHLSHHPGTTRDTLFIWKMALPDNLESIQQRYDAINNGMRMRIIKQTPVPSEWDRITAELHKLADICGISMSAPGTEHLADTTQGLKTYKLSYRPRGWIKLDDKRIGVDIRVRKVNIGTFSVVMDGKYMKMKFQTRDLEHLSKHPGTTKDTVFIWKMPLPEHLISIQSHYDVVREVISVKIIKKDPCEANIIPPELAKLASICGIPFNPSPAEHKTKKKTKRRPKEKMRNSDITASQSSTTQCKDNTDSVPTLPITNLTTRPAPTNSKTDFSSMDKVIDGRSILCAMFGAFDDSPANTIQGNVTSKNTHNKSRMAGRLSLDKTHIKSDMDHVGYGANTRLKRPSFYDLFIYS